MTDALGKAALAGAVSTGAEALPIRICGYHIQACRGCGTCLVNGGECVLGEDDAPALFCEMQAASALLFAAPIYFYALPGLFKIFIDRSQKFWADSGSKNQPLRNAAVIMAAGRQKGEKLFAGALLTLKWFLKPFGFAISQTLLLRGLETVADVSRINLRQAEELGRSLALNPGSCNS